MMLQVVISVALCCVPAGSVQPVPDAGIDFAQVGVGGGNPLHTLCPALLLEIQGYGELIAAQQAAVASLEEQIRLLQFQIDILESVFNPTQEQLDELADLKSQESQLRLQWLIKLQSIQILTQEKNDLVDQYHALGCDAVSGALP